MLRAAALLSAGARATVLVQLVGGCSMPEIYVGKVAEFIENDRKIVKDGDLEIGVLHHKGTFYAYRNQCLHQGGPACEGMIIAKVEEVIAPDKTYLGQKFSETENHFVCPWHGWEYDIETGEFVVDRRKKLKKYAVVQKDQEVYVVV
jgi:nitrite reductase/ring-hydroxylating ferredoxin subunit